MFRPTQQDAAAWLLLAALAPAGARAGELPQ
jgi:hypothetical protein